MIHVPYILSLFLSFLGLIVDFFILTFFLIRPLLSLSFRSISQRRFNYKNNLDDDYNNNNNNNKNDNDGNDGNDDNNNKQSTVYLII